ncbi:hypothetical protein [Pectobacterium colocasium]|uniref:hypothetical protein n=1 Tax=Pectobacterium colocasium TaxID=2878098 RepID=UPI003B284BA5
MEFNINGDSNRVAGRDYHEHQYHIIPCPDCEKGYLSPGRRRCRHCDQELELIELQRKKDELRRKKQAKIIRYISYMILGAVLGMLVNHLGPKSLQGFSQVTTAVFIFLALITSKIFL